MSPENFCYWLQGLLELQPDLKRLDADQVKMVRDHLGYVFTHVEANKQPPRVPATFPGLMPGFPNGLSQAIGITPPGAVSIC